MVTFTVYCFVVVPSSAVTSYVTAVVKLFTVCPDTCAVVPTFAVDPVDRVKVEIKFETFVPEGTVIEILFPLIIPVICGLVKP